MRKGMNRGHLQDRLTTGDKYFIGFVIICCSIILLGCVFPPDEDVDYGEKELMEEISERS